MTVEIGDLVELRCILVMVIDNNKGVTILTADVISVGRISRSHINSTYSHQVFRLWSDPVLTIS